MDFWSGITSGAVTGILSGAGQFAKDIRTAITGEESLTSEQRARLLEQAGALEAAVLNADVVAAQGQIEINKIEAASDSLFKSGWRPAVGWICVAGLGMTFIVSPLLPWLAAVAGFTVPPFPEIPMDDLTILLLSILGLGGMRTVEKMQRFRPDSK